MKSNNLASVFRSVLYLIFIVIIFSCETEEPIPTPTYTLSTLVSPSEGGKINISPSAGPYNEGQTVTLTPEANPNWVFQKWEGDASGSSSPLTITMNSNKSVTAVFVKRDYPLNITYEGEGTVNEVIVTNPSGREYPHGTTVELTPVPASGWVFESWGGDLSGTEVPKRITVDGVKNVTAKFKLREYPLNITIEGEGSVTEVIVTNSSGREFPHGTTVELTPVPASGWVFESWGGDLEGNEVPKEILVDGEKNVTVTFKQGSTSMFYLAENGITCKCEGANPGDMGMINGVEYEAVDNELIRQRRDEGVDMTKLCTSLVTDMVKLFSDRVFSQAIGNWDVENVIIMEGMFEGTNFNHPIGNWDVSNVVDMGHMFYESQFNQSIANWDTGNVTNMEGMFRGSRFNQSLADWNVHNVTNMAAMFGGSSFNQSIENWDVSRVTTMWEMFAVSPFNHPIGNWDVEKVTDMGGMFRLAESFNQPLGDWDVSNVTNMTSMFVGTKFNQPIGDWDVSNVTNMSGMFLFSPFNQVIGDWDVGNVTSMSEMFGNSQFVSVSHFNQPIGDWNVSNVTNMNGMFNGNSRFNQDLSKWCVTNITSRPILFRNGAIRWLLPKPVWGTCPD